MSNYNSSYTVFNNGDIAIANYLDRICTRIDSAITNFTQQIDTLKELKARLISDTATGKIDVRNITVPE